MYRDLRGLCDAQTRTPPAVGPHQNLQGHQCKCGDLLTTCSRSAHRQEVKGLQRKPYSQSRVEDRGFVHVHADSDSELSEFSQQIWIAVCSCRAPPNLSVLSITRTRDIERDAADDSRPYHLFPIDLPHRAACMRLAWEGRVVIVVVLFLFLFFFFITIAEQGGHSELAGLVERSSVEATQPAGR